MEYLKSKLSLIFVFLILSISGFSQDAKMDDGYKIFYHPNGKKSSEGLLIDGKPNGYWKNYYITGIKKSEGNRKNFLLDSIWVFYDNLGDTSIKISYLYGKKNGYYSKYEYSELKKRNVLISKELYVNDILEGKSYYFYKNGELKKIVEYQDGKKNNREFVFNDKGLIIEENRYIKGNLIEHNKINQYNSENKKTGIWREYYDDLKLKSEIEYIEGKRSGYFKEYNKNGNIEKSIYFENDEIVQDTSNIKNKIEIKLEYYSNGNIKSKRPFYDTIPVGIHRYYDSTGTIYESIIYDENGIILSKGIISDEGKKEGKWTDFYKSGKIKAEGNYVNNLRNGIWKYYYKSERIEQTGRFLNDRYEGLWTWYFENGDIRKEENYYLGKEDGMSIEYNEEGVEIAKGEFIDGEKEGEWYYDVGDQKEIGKYIAGLKDGKWKWYFKDGTVMFEGNYIQGIPDGKHIYYYDNGIIREEQFYVNGYKEKTWKKFDRLGNVDFTITYKDDKEIKINGIKIDLPDVSPRIID